MNDRTNSSAHAFGAIAAEGAGAAVAGSGCSHVTTDQQHDKRELLTLNDHYVGGRWTDRYWDEQRQLAFGTRRSLADIDAALMGISAVTHLLSCDEVQARDARENPDQVQYSALCPTVREGLRAAQALMISNAICAIERVRANGL